MSLVCEPPAGDPTLLLLDDALCGMLRLEYVALQDLMIVMCELGVGL